MWGLGFRVQGLGFRVEGSGFTFWGLRVWGLEFSISGLGVRVEGMECRKPITTFPFGYMRDGKWMLLHDSGFGFRASSRTPPK